MHRNRSVDVHQFSMIPRADIPRASFRMQKTYKSTFDAAFLYPIFCEEVLPGDTFRFSMTAFARLATPLFPIMDNLHFECFWFYCPNRLLWLQWTKFMGEKFNPADSTVYTIPQITSPVNGYAIGSIYDYMGLPTVGQVVTGYTVTHSVLPLRMYNFVYNEWFRDENLVNSAEDYRSTDGPDPVATAYVLRRRGKRHDYFTSCLPFAQKGPAMPIFGSSAPVLANPGTGPTFNIPGFGNQVLNATVGTGAVVTATPPSGTGNMLWSNTNLFADLAGASLNTINQLRQAFQVQRLLERDARGGTRYTEIVRSHFGVISPDARLQRPEYLGGSSIPIAINPVAQTSATAVTGSDTPQGTLSAIGTGLLRSSFTQSFTEHGYIMCLINVRADLTYQQGLRRHWSRLSRYDFYFPVFAMLGEQSVLSQEIFFTGIPGGGDQAVFGYQERWAEYRYMPSEVTSLFRSTAAQTIDPWHLAERFATRPGLNQTFIEDHSDATVERAIAVGEAAGGQQFLLDVFFDGQVTRPMPLYSVPGMIDHF